MHTRSVQFVTATGCTLHIARLTSPAFVSGISLIVLPQVTTLKETEMNVLTQRKTNNLQQSTVFQGCGVVCVSAALLVVLLPA